MDLARWSNFDFQELEIAKTITESLQTLRRLKLFILISFNLAPDPLGGICDELEAISGRNKLEFIEIHLDVFHYRPNILWHRLEEVLIKFGWPELKCVSITVTFVDRFETAAFERARSLDTRFLRLKRSKQLDFQFFPPPQATSLTGDIHYGCQ